MTNREEVAGKLRRIEEDIDYETAFMEIDTMIGTKDNYSFSFFFNRLADLIDPTCKNKQVDINKMAPIEFRADNFICSNCGETFCADKEGVNAPIDWSYCPNCGARVVSDD